MTETESRISSSELESREGEITEKRKRIHGLLEKHDLNAIVISRHENIAWATAGVVDLRVPLLRETGVGSLLITKQGDAYYLTTNNEAPRLADEEFAGLNYQPLVHPWYANDLEALIGKIVGNGKVAGDIPLGATAPIALQPLRFELTANEVLRYRWLGQHTADAATVLLQALRPGLREITMQGMLAESLLSKGILPSVFLTAVDDRIRRYRHAVPRRGVLERFGMLNFCARRWGLCVSMTRYVHFGAMPAELEGKFLAVAQVNARLLAATREGTTGDELFTVAKDAYSAAGYPGEEREHHQGGATGYLEREWVARPGGSERVVVQQAFAWNPNLPGAKVEDTYVLRAGMMEALTGTPKLPVVSTKWQGVDYQSAGVLMG